MKNLSKIPDIENTIKWLNWKKPQNPTYWEQYYVVLYWPDFTFELKSVLWQESDFVIDFNKDNYYYKFLKSQYNSNYILYKIPFTNKNKTMSDWEDFNINIFLHKLNNYNDEYDKKLKELQKANGKNLSSHDIIELQFFTKKYFYLQKTEYIDQCGNNYTGERKTIFLTDIIITDCIYWVIDDKSLVDRLEIKINWYENTIKVGNVINKQRIKELNTSNSNEINNFISEQMDLWCYENMYFIWDYCDNLIWKKFDWHFTLSYDFFWYLNIEFDIFKKMNIYKS
jgi:hypothetical protein